MTVQSLPTRSERQTHYEERLQFWRREAQLAAPAGGQAFELAMRFAAFFEARVADLRGGHRRD